MEKWKTVKNYEGIYEVSTLGRVRRLHADGKVKSYLSTKAKEGNYVRVQLSKDGQTKLHLIHRLVAEAFIENAENFPVVNHIDGNKQNNVAENLEWLTHRDNMKHASDTGLKVKGVWNPVVVDGIEYDCVAAAGRATGKHSSYYADELVKARENKKIILTNVDSGEKLEFKNKTKAAEFLGISKQRFDQIKDRGSYSNFTWEVR